MPAQAAPRRQLTVPCPLEVAAGDLDRAVPAGQAALRRLPTVRSRRCTLVLHRLETDFAAIPATRRPASVRALQDQLRATHTA